LLVLSLFTSAVAQTPDDRYIAGYAAAVLEREFRLPDATLTVENGRITGYVQDLSGADVDKIRTVLGRIRGVASGGVKLVEKRAPQSVTSLPDQSPVAPTPASSGSSPVSTGSAPGSTGSDPVTTGPTLPYDLDGQPGMVKQEVKADDWALLPRTKLFAPLLADPRWPHFSASWDRYDNSGASSLKNVGSISFGESFSFYRSDVPFARSRWDFGVQAGVFAIFDLDSDSKNLVSADYFGGPTLSYRYKNFSMLTRIYHQSSHLGDEFILDNNITQAQRINLSYEEVDLLLSYDIGNFLRVYGGGGYIVNVEPSTYDRGVLQYGFEFTSPWKAFNGAVTPVVMADFKNADENGYAVDISARAGVRIENPRSASQRIYLLLEYYNGRSPNGQFFIEKIEYYGVGLHVYF